MASGWRLRHDSRRTDSSDKVRQKVLIANAGYRTRPVVYLGFCSYSYWSLHSSDVRLVFYLPTDRLQLLDWRFVTFRLTVRAIFAVVVVKLVSWIAVIFSVTIVAFARCCR